MMPKAWLAGLMVALTLGAATPAAAQDGLRAGAAAVDVTPVKFPVIVNGMFEQRTADKAHDPLMARALVLDDGRARLAIVVVDSCMMPRELLDEAKGMASKATGIPVERTLISATHTHSAPAAMGCLGSDADVAYQKFLPPKIAEAVEKAAARLAPAKAGWGVVDVPDHTACRRWVFRPDRMRVDPFGVPSVRANMHPGYNSADAIGPAGPDDPGLSVLSVQSADGKPVAVLANYSMHYFGSPMLSADYFGVFAKKIGEMVGAGDGFVGIMSQGTSGDSWLGDYSLRAARKWTMEQYATELAELAHGVIRKVEHRADVTLGMAETKLKLRRRVADEARLKWAKETVAKFEGRLPKTQAEIYAREQLFLAAESERELVLQAVRVGDLGITAIPNEVYALTGLKLKAMSPLRPTFNVSLANGSEGYIPPPEQHRLGGYTTWAARTAALEEQAEPKIVEAVLKLLENVSGQPRRKVEEVSNAYVQEVGKATPLAHWRLGEMAGRAAKDASGNGHDGAYEDGVVFYLDGVMQGARAAHFADGRMKASVKRLGSAYSIEMWVWNGLAHEARPVTAYLFSRGTDGEKEGGEHVGIGGAAVAGGKLIFFNGNRLNEVVSGRTTLEPKRWHHVVVVRDGKKVTLYLDGKEDGDGKAERGVADDVDGVFVGGRSDNFANLEGKIDEALVYGRALTAEEVGRHFAAAGVKAAAARAPFKRDSEPLTPQQSLAALHLRPGFEVELVASEPLVHDPVAIDWGMDGRLWVVEMADYPYGTDGKMKPGGRVKFLTDTDGDGKYDEAKLFLDGLNFPNGIVAYRKGVIVTAAPEIFYAEDADGDGKADRRQTLYTGFKEGNVQLRVNGLRWGLDGWLYCANGWSGGVVKSIRTGQTLDIKGRDLRIHPDTGGMELLSGVSQFGRSRDDAGNWFGCDNSHPLFHYVLEDAYLRRNPHAAVIDPKRQVLTPANPKVFPRSRGQKRYHSFEHGGHFTSACSLMIYRDDLLFEGQGTGDGGQAKGMHAFVCEPVHNLVQHQVLGEKGTSFEVARAQGEENIDFLASEDPWFRPVMVRAGPDGALWVVDMYRYMIEHPDWLPEEGKKELEPYYRDGAERGRIYRVYPSGKRPRSVPRLDRMSAAELVEALDHPSGWVRDAAQQMLVERNADGVERWLEETARSHEQGVARLHALCVLGVVGKLPAGVIERALGDADAAVRRWALRWAEQPGRQSPELVAPAAKLATDADVQVRLQLACSLGQWESSAAAEALARLVAEDDPYIRAAVVSSAIPHFEAVVKACANALPAGGLWDGLMATAMGLERRSAMAALLGAVIGVESVEQMQALARWLDMLAAKGLTPEKLAAKAPEDELAGQIRRLPTAYAAARKVLRDPTRLGISGSAAAVLLGCEATLWEADREVLSALLSPQAPGEVQAAAVKAVARMGDKAGFATAPAVLLRGWKGHSPALRAGIVDALVARPEWAVELLGAVEDGRVSVVEIDTARRERLLKHSSAQVKAKAKGVFGGGPSSSREQVVAEHRPVLELKGDAKRGLKPFTVHCATCHRVGGVGQDLGPNLASVRAWTAEAMLTAILDPDKAVEPRYVSYTATLKGGAQVFGIVTAEAAGSIKLKGLDGQEVAVLRSDLASLESSGRSLMPLGLESAMSRQEIADVIEYVRRGGSE